MVFKMRILGLGEDPMAGNSYTLPKAGNIPQSPANWTHNASLVGKATLLQGNVGGDVKIE